MLKAGSLSYTIFVSTITAILCTLMILLAYFNRSFFIQNDVYDKARDNAESGIALGIKANSQADYFEWLELYNERSDSVRVFKRKWGAYEVTHSLAEIGEIQHQKTLIFGYKSTGLLNTALWLSDRNRPLQLSGDALLKGNAALPKKGLDRAYIEGSNYSRKELIYGNTSLSKQQLPGLPSKLGDYWWAYLNKKVGLRDSLVELDKATQKLVHSFGKKTIIYFSRDAIQLQGYEHSGNIIFMSDKAITVGAGSKFEQVIVMAPTVEIEDGFTGSIHAIASDTLIFGAVDLKYPSSGITVNRNKEIPYLKLEERALIRGCLLSFEEKTNRRNNNLAIEIAKGATLKGVVYCTGNLELNGKIEGSVITNNFLLKTASGIYENHLLDGEIDRSLLDADFAGFQLEDFKNHVKPILWF